MTANEPSSPSQTIRLGAALREMAHHPFGLLQDWNWKTATLSALIRAVVFFRVNLRAGHAAASRAMLVEAVYAIVAAGLAGAVLQRLRHAEPRRQTALLICLLIPFSLLAMQALVHAVMGTPRLGWSLLASFCMAALGTGFNWFAMSRGALVTGAPRSLAGDLLLLPRLIWQFVTALPQAVFSGNDANKPPM